MRILIKTSVVGKYFGSTAFHTEREVSVNDEMVVVDTSIENAYVKAMMGAGVANFNPDDEYACREAALRYWTILIEKVTAVAPKVISYGFIEVTSDTESWSYTTRAAASRRI